MDPTHWLLALLAASVVAGAARARRSLTVNGTIAAIALGTALVGTAGWWAGLLLVTFFASSSLLSHRGTSTPHIDQARGSERDAIQVVANGGVALAASILFGLTGSPGWMLLLAGGIAAANADTWSTEVGRTSRSLPRLITTGKTVPPGTSGAVSRRGLLGALGGGLLIGAIAAIGWAAGSMPGPLEWATAGIGVAFGGVSGSIFDSMIGATLQNQRWCDTCNKGTEARVHRCGTPTRSIRGVPWIDNDVVNLGCSLAGGMTAWIMANALIV